MKDIHHLFKSIIIFILVGITAITGDPQFSELIQNVTVTLGREATLSCVIDNLAEYKVGWLRAEDQTILSLHRRVVTHNPRVDVTTSVSVSSTQQSRTWNLLHIRQIKESDQGCYMCQINTMVMKKLLGCIQVQVPPNIVDDENNDVSVNEGDNVTLTCKATGKPVPRIVWRREDGQKLITNNHKWNTTNVISNSDNLQQNSVSSNEEGVQETKVDDERGEKLRLYRVTRQMMAVYLCIASNDVPPIVSKRVALNVNFAPLVTTTTNQIAHSALLGIEIRLTCQIESHPPSVNHWMKRDHNSDIKVILPSAKYKIEDENKSWSSNYKTNTTLTIHDIRPEDIRCSYICVAINFMGQTEASIDLQGMVETTTISTITQPTASSTIFSIKAKQDEDNSISAGIQFKFNEESVLNNKSHTHNAKKKKHWHHHKEEHRRGNISQSLDQQLKREKISKSTANSNQQLFSNAKSGTSISIWFFPFSIIISTLFSTKLLGVLF